MEKSCGALVFRQQGGERLYLLLHYAKKHWDFPKGHVESGETEEVTARREIEEETGISSLSFLPGFHETISYEFMRFGKKVKKEVVYFIARTEEEKVRLSDEHVGFEWMGCAPALRRLTFPNARRLLLKAEASLSPKAP